MASLFKKKNGRYYVQFGSGRTKKQYSLGTTRKDVARGHLRSLERAIEARTFDPESEHPRVVLDPSAAPRKGSGEPSTLSEIVEEFLKSRRHLKPATRQNYRMVTDKLLRCEGDPEKVMESDTKEHLAVTSQHTYRTQLNVFYNWAIKEGYMHDNPIKKITLRRMPVGRPNFFTREEIEHLFKYIQAEADPMEASWLAPMIVFCCYTGLRLNEAVGLRWDQVREDRIHFGAGETKSGRAEEVFLPEQARLALALLPEPTGERVFCDLEKLYVTKRFTYWRKKSGLREGTFHTLRHTCASWMAMSGCSPEIIRRHLRHATLKITQRYMHLSPSRQDELVQKAFE